MSYYFTFNFPENLNPCSVNDLLRQLLIPRKWRHFLRVERKVQINGSYYHFNQKVKQKDKVELWLDHVESKQHIYPESGKIPEVIYEDENLLIINKPAGQKTHPNLKEANTALNDCATYLGFSPFIVHRLDMLTSGLLLVAKNPAVVPILNRELTAKIFHREYLAVININEPIANRATIDLPIGQDPLDQRKRKVTGTGIKSITHYQIVKYFDNNTALVKLELETGRTHQIRVHLAAIDCPIVGDPLYNPDFKNEQFLHLTAYQISLQKPFSLDKLKVKLSHKDIPLLQN
ncbi:RluA family pseudouridine synthase [Lactobacillus sp. ESL0261]|uniref:RluA family pseudouridine synthase n=1 Tax=Lactobacillus sp. ESL0261 TaxID=2069348 RepID=UPI000EFBD054|nr:RluA family pseudouridine synthase [Lactobacillus sp. ESL0261]RMC54315.1 RluA family pseudouridine synthase [Lactobacillus sp. ESL0261]